MLVKQGERLQVFLNKVKVFESEKAIPAGFLFDQLSLDHQRHVRRERPDVHQQPDDPEEMTLVKTVVVLVSAIATLLTVQAPTNRSGAEAEDRVFGWMKIYDLGTPPRH